MTAEFLRSYIAKQPAEVRASFQQRPKGRVATLLIKEARRAWKACDPLARLEAGEPLELCDVLGRTFPRSTPSEKMVPLILFLSKHNYTVGLGSRGPWLVVPV